MADEGARVQMIVENVPAAIVEAVDSYAEETGQSINDATVGVLAERYGVAFVASSYPRIRKAESTTWVLRMPAELRDAIAAHAAARRGDTRRGVILATLAERFGLVAVDARRGA